jgi:hypothetical protein
MEKNKNIQGIVHMFTSWNELQNNVRPAQLTQSSTQQAFRLYRHVMTEIIDDRWTKSKILAMPGCEPNIIHPYISLQKSNDRI